MASTARSEPTQHPRKTRFATRLPACRQPHPGVRRHALGLTRSNVSNHLTCLRDCGIVVAEPEGRQTRYEIADPHLGAAMTALVEVTLAVDENAPCVDATCTVPGCCPSGTVA
uniref:ArsR/SmtB family transcription factor n=1 Tax=Georgenia sp. M64 TaxID=3120520 RepID=UPI0040499188